MCLPPKVAPYHTVIIPVLAKPERAAEILAYAEGIQKELAAFSYAGRPLAIHIDNRDVRGGEKNWEWIKKGVPLRIEVGPRDVDAQNVTIARRDLLGTKSTLSKAGLGDEVVKVLDAMQKGYFAKALAFKRENIRSDITTLDELKAFFTPQNADKPEIHGGFVLAKWCGDPKTEALLEELKITIRCLPLEQRGTTGRCILTGQPAVVDVILAKAY